MRNKKICESDSARNETQMEAVAGLARDERNPTFGEIRMARWVTAAPNPTYGLPSNPSLLLRKQYLSLREQMLVPKGLEQLA